MEESDKTRALKKAYAEIILNTAKDSAARVMISDRKSARFHHDLFETNEEAHRLLVRLKHMIDAKMIEADVISSNQQRQIDVLEAQLHEAEDIITDLRSEVRWVRDRLEKAKAFESQELGLVNIEEEETVSVHKVVVESLNPDQEDRCSLHDVECENDENLEKPKASDSQERSLSDMEEEMVSAQKIDPQVVLESSKPDQEVHYAECENDDNLEIANASESQERNFVNLEEEMVSAQKVVLESLKPDQEVADTCKRHDTECENDVKHFDVVASLKGKDVCESESDGDIRIKKLELSRNGCTQRIHALERNSSSSANEGEQQGTTEKDSEESLSSGKAGTLGNTRCLVLALRASSAKVVTFPSNALGIKKPKLRRRRKRRFGKPKAKSVRTQSQLLKPCQSQSIVTCLKTSTSDGEDSMETHLSVVRDDLKSCKELKEHLQFKRTLYSGDSKEKSCKNMHQTDHLVEACQESNFVSTNVEVADIPESESPRANVNRLLKYTFQRKRKRGSANINEDSNNLPRKHQENEAQDQIESTLSNEPSKGNPPQLAEVATHVSDFIVLCLGTGRAFKSSTSMLKRKRLL